MQKENYRFYIQVRHFFGISAIEIYRELEMFDASSAPSYETVRRWCNQFNKGRATLEDHPRPGRPIVETTQENIELVRLAIECNPYATYDELEVETDLSRGVLQVIIHEHLKMRKVTSRYVPYMLSDENRRKRLEVCKQNLAKFKSNEWRLCEIITGDESWFYHRQIGKKQSNSSWLANGESPRTVVKRNRNEPKTMVSVFFRSTGLVHLTYLECGETIDYNVYLKYSLKPLVKEINKERPRTGTRGLKFHHDNARPHVKKEVISYIKSQGFIIMPHPPYSPDLAPCDYWLFNYIKERLDDHRNEKSLCDQIVKIMLSIPHSEYIKTFEKWIVRMERCVEHNGDYFEHLYQ
jgi:histone-lysine N-methyltransferase SETMAR